jgi:hypothetical protein
MRASPVEIQVGIGRPGRTPATGEPAKSDTSHRHKSWVVADQIASSATNFAGSALAAGLLTAGDFGSWSIGFTAYVLVLAATRTWAGDVLLLVVPAERQSDKVYASGATTLALAVGTVTGVCFLVLGLLPDGSLGAALTALGLVLPTMLVQDAIRYSLLAQGRAREACLNDTIWFGLAVAGLMILRLTDTDSVFLAMLAWGAPTIVCSAVGLLQTGAAPQRANLSIWIHRVRHLSSRISAEYVVFIISSMSFLITVLGVTRDMSSVGAVRGAQVLLGPSTVIFAATTIIVTPQMVRRHREGEPIVRTGIRQSIINAVAIIAFGTAALMTPDAIGVRIFGATWDPAVAKLPIIALAFLGAAASTGALTIMRARGAVGRSLRLHAALAVVVFLATGLGLAAAGSEGAILGYSLAAACGPLLLWSGALGVNSAKSVGGFHRSAKDRLA